MDHTASGGLEARRLLEIAEKLLDACDLVGSKRFAERALESDPLLDGVDLILAITDVLLATQRRVNNQVDCYAILQLQYSSSGHGDDSFVIKRSYRRLAFLLSPGRIRFPLADSAFRFVVDAYAVLSDPVKKTQFDAELEKAASHLRSNSSVEDHPARQPDQVFWTSCSSCCHVYEYDAAYLNRTLRCQTCRQPFRAGEMAGKPSIVPGIDMYYCSWGFFPIGLSDGSASNVIPKSEISGVPECDEDLKTFYPVNPLRETKCSTHTEKPLNAVPTNVTAFATNYNDGAKNQAAVRRRATKAYKKAVAKKRVGNYSVKKSIAVGSEQINGGMAIRGARGSEADATSGVGNLHFDIDLDASADVMGNVHNFHTLHTLSNLHNVNNMHDLNKLHNMNNLHNLPFLREEDIQIQLP